MQDVGADVSDTQNFDPYMQPNTIPFRTGPTPKTTKHDHLYELNLTPLVLHSLTMLDEAFFCNQSCPK
jgi:hypothetical protein